MEQAAELGLERGEGDGPDEEMMATIGLPASAIDTVVDVAAHIPARLAARPARGSAW